MKLIMSSLQYSALVVLAVLAYLLILIKTGGNSMVMQLVGMFAISLVAMFLIVRIYLHSEANPYTFVTSLKMGVLGGAFSAAFLLGIEAILYAISEIQLAPEVMLDNNFPYLAMQLMLALGMVAYSVISSFACFQFFKRPLKGSRYRKPKDWSTQEPR